MQLGIVALFVVCLDKFPLHTVILCDVLNKDRYITTGIYIEYVEDTTEKVNEPKYLFGNLGPKYVPTKRVGYYLHGILSNCEANGTRYMLRRVESKSDISSFPPQYGVPFAMLEDGEVYLGRKPKHSNYVAAFGSISIALCMAVGIVGLMCAIRNDPRCYSRNAADDTEEEEYNIVLLEVDTAETASSSSSV